ncbi:MAG: tetratricopeptide repeat protein [Nitrospirota bacterium]
MSTTNVLRALVALTMVLCVSGVSAGATSEEVAQAYFDEGKELNKQRRFDEALAKFTLAVQASPETHRYHQALFMTYMALRRGLAAIDFYKQMAREHPDSPTVRYWLGRLYLQSQALDDAVREFQTAGRLAPNDEHAWISLGHTYIRQGKDAEAMAAYQRANKLSPNIAVVHAGLGKLYLKRGDYPKAQRELEEALRLDAALTEARFDLSLIYEKQGETIKAVKEWQRILEDDPNETSARERLARTFFEKQLYEDAVREYSTLSQVRQASPEVFLALGEAQVMLATSLTDAAEKSQLTNLAIENFQRTLELDPGNAQARKYLDLLRPTDAPAQVPQ